VNKFTVLYGTGRFIAVFVWRIILKRILDKYGIKLWTELNWLRIGFNGIVM
jgi:hypothetical protein